MDRRLNLIRNILPIIDEYCELSSDSSTLGLASYIQTRNTKQEELHNGSDDAIELIQKYNNLHATISFHLSRLGQYAKYYIKAALQDSAITNADDFAYLATALEYNGISKTSLITHNISEIPHGMDVIKRLVQKGFLIERVKKEDRRVKLLTVSESGHSAFLNATTQMEKVGNIIVGELSENEKQVLRSLLKKLDRFHQKIYNKSRKYDLDGILKEISASK